MASSSSDGEESWEDVGSSEEEEGRCPCLFCSRELDTAGEVLNHCTTEHGLDLLAIRAKLGLDFYSCMKLINYIRSEHPTPARLQSVVQPPFPWDQDQYFKPVLAEDPLLQYDFEGSVGEEEEGGKGEEEGRVGNVERPDGVGGKDESALLQRLCISERKVEEYKSALSQAVSDLESMRLVVRELFSDDVSTKPNPSDGLHSNQEEDEEEEEGYFSTYSHFSIHEEMLKDEVRTESYRVFVENNPQLFKDKVVLDVGCGTGILSMFAARAGAFRVIGVDQSNIIYRAMDIVRENGFEKKITLIKGRVEEVELPVEKVDVIISEWMGYFLLFESMLDTVLFARDKWLKDPSQVFPNNCSLSLVAMGDKYEREERIDFWDNVQGFKMGCLKTEVLQEATVHIVDPYSTISSNDTIKKFDISKVTTSDLSFEAPFTLTMQQDTLCHALVGYFDVGFDVEAGYSMHFSTSPQDTPTHWKQTVFYFKDPIPVHTGDLLQGTVFCHKNRRDPRSLEIVFRVEHSSFLPDTKLTRIEQKFSLQ